MEKINKKMATGVVWMVGFKMLERSLGLISTIILARLLIPEDFGMVAMAMSIIAVLELLSAFNFDVVLIQKRDPQASHYNTAWTLNVLFGLLSAGILFLLAGPTATFYGEPRLDTVIYLLALSRLARGFENIGTVTFRKEMNFDKEFRFLLSKKLAGFLVTVPLAFILHNYWALVAGILFGNIFAVLYSYRIHNYRPRLCMAAFHELFHFSKWLLLNNILFFLKIRSADFIIGKLVGIRGLGLHSISYEISNLPTTELVAPINRAVFPGYAKMSHDLAILRQGYLNVIGMIAIITLPIAIGLAVTAELLVPVFLGAKWLDAIELIQILALFGALSAIQTNIGSVYIALGRPKILTLLAIAYLSVFIPSLIYLTQNHGLFGAACSYLLAALIFLPINYIVMFRIIDLESRNFFAVIWRPVLATTVMFLLTSLLMENFAATTVFSQQLLQLTCTVLIGALCYVAMILGSWVLSGKPEGAEKYIIDRVLPLIYFRLRPGNKDRGTG